VSAEYKAPTYTVRLDEEERYGDPYLVLRIARNGVDIEERSDRGEPEDNSYYRDWGWVPGALRKAYEFGLADGREAEQRASAAAADGACPALPISTTRTEGSNDG
jgi:hypothetical protein